MLPSIHRPPKTVRISTEHRVIRQKRFDIGAGFNNQRQQSLNRFRCYVNDQRRTRIEALLQQTLNDWIMKDEILANAVNPQQSGASDAFPLAMACISKVECTRGIERADVFVSVFSDTQGQKQAIQNLRALKHYIRTKLFKKMSMKTSPEISFVLDRQRQQEAIRDIEFKSLRYSADSEETRQQILLKERQQVMSKFFDDLEDDVEPLQTFDDTVKLDNIAEQAQQLQRSNISLSDHYDNPFADTKLVLKRSKIPHQKESLSLKRDPSISVDTWKKQQIKIRKAQKKGRLPKHI